MNKWPVSLNQITRLQIELTSFCNAYCPSCERASYVEEENDYYRKPLNTSQLNFNDLKKWLNYDFNELRSIHFCGNIDEPTLHKDLIEICKHFTSKYPNIFCNISTNGGTRNEKFWSDLGKIERVNCIFGIDGLKDTNHIYRKNVNWKKLERNFRAFIDSGGIGIWQFIIFEHNKHQVFEAKELSKKEGFKIFQKKYSGRENKEVKSVQHKKLISEKIKCKATYHNIELEKSFFIDSAANVWPCCWMATAKHKRQFANVIGNKYSYYLSNNLKYNTFDEIVESDMFSYLYKSFDKLDVCNMMCKYNSTDFDIHETDDDEIRKIIEERMDFLNEV